MLSPRIRILSPTYWGATLASTVNTHAVTIMTNSSNTIIDEPSVPSTWAQRRFLVPPSKSIAHHDPVSKQNPPIASPDASLISVRDWLCI